MYRTLQKTKDQPRIVVKQIVKQEQRAMTKQRTAGVRAAKKKSIGDARKRYTQVKKAILKALRAGKKKAYTSQNTKIKAMPAAQRKAARDKVRAALKAKLDKLLRDIRPASAYKRVEMIEAAITTLRKLRWT
jgi:hypothetical protein